MTEEQEGEVIGKCVKLAMDVTGKKPVGYRAPLYQIRETTIPILEKHGFEYGKVLPFPFTTRYGTLPSLPTRHQ